MIILQIVWAYIKKYWELIALIVFFVIGYFLFRRKDIAFSERLQEINDSHLKEINRINKIREDEARLKAENNARLQRELIAIKQQYDLKKEQLEKEVQLEVEQVSEKYKNNPKRLAMEISKISGFEVVHIDESKGDKK